MKEHPRFKGREGLEQVAEKIRDAVMSDIDSTIKQFDVVNDEDLEHPLVRYGMSFVAEAAMVKVLFPLMTSAAGGERSFSVYGNTHTKKRNRMNAAKLDSLVRLRNEHKSTQAPQRVYTVQVQVA